MTGSTYRSAIPSPRCIGRRGSLGDHADGVWRGRRRRRQRRAAAAAVAATSTEVKLGYFPNLTHASAIVGIDKGYFKDKHRGRRLDAEDPRLQQWQRHHRRTSRRRPRHHVHRPQPRDHGVREVAQRQPRSRAPRLAAHRWSSSDDITSPEDLKGKTLATPGLANTQDVALKFWLERARATRSPPTAGRRHRAQPGQQPHRPAVQAGDIDGAWVPEPYASRAGRRGRHHARRRGGPVAGRPVRHHAHPGRTTTSSRSTPTWSTTSSRARSRPTSTSPTTPMRPSSWSATTSPTSPAARSRGRSRLRLGTAHLHQRPDRGLADRELPTTLSTQVSSRQSTTWPTSTTSMHSTSCLPTPASRKCQDHLRDDHIARGCCPRSPHGLRGRPSASRESVKRSAAAAISPWP